MLAGVSKIAKVFYSRYVWPLVSGVILLINGSITAMILSDVKIIVGLFNQGVFSFVMGRSTAN